MTANFYKMQYGNYNNSILLASKNIDCVPQKGNFIMFSGQLFIVDRIYFDLDNCKYNIYMARL